MKNSIIKTLIIGVIIAFYSCENNTVNIESDIPVVEAYLMPGSSINQVKITTLIPYSTDEETGSQDPISGLEILITENENSYLLNPIDNNPGYYSYSDQDLVIGENKTFTLEFEYNGKLISATTITPEKPTGFSISNSTIYVERMEEGSVPSGGSSDETYEILWDNPDESYYYITISCIEENYDFINYMLEDMLENDSEIDIEDFISTLSEPSTLDVYNINSRRLTFFGTYEVVLFKVNQEYVDLYDKYAEGYRCKYE